MKRNSNFLINSFLIIILIFLVLIAIVRIIKVGVNIELLFSVNSFILICCFLIYLNLNVLLGMIFTNIVFLLYIFFILIFSPEKLFQFSNFIGLIACFYLTVEGIIIYKKKIQNKDSKKDKMNATTK